MGIWYSSLGAVCSSLPRHLVFIVLNMLKLVEHKRTKLMARSKPVLDAYPFKDKTGRLMFEEIAAKLVPSTVGDRRAHRVHR